MFAVSVRSSESEVITVSDTKATSATTYTALLITVSAMGTVSCEVREDPKPSYTTGYSTWSTYRDLAELLARTDLVIPKGTPIKRFDLADYSEVARFAVRGPMDAADLPANTVHKLGGRPEPYNGERWDEVGSLARVSLDVYLRLVEQAGLPIEYTS